MYDSQNTDELIEEDNSFVGKDELTNWYLRKLNKAFENVIRNLEDDSFVGKDELTNQDVQEKLQKLLKMLLKFRR